MPDPVPRVIDHRPRRFPGGARGAPPPELPPGRSVLAWFDDGTFALLDVAAGDDDRPELAPGEWAKVVEWTPA